VSGQSVRTLVFDGSGKLYAGGRFTDAGGVGAADRVAMWDGNSWSALGTGMNERVYALAYDSANGKLYAGGRFTTAGGNPASYIAVWDGTNWSALGAGMNDYVWALAVDGSGNLYVGGEFDDLAGGPGSTYNSIAMWNGAWNALGTGMNNDVYALDIDGGGNLYAGGRFTTAGGNPANRVALWSGGSWSALGAGMNNRVRALALDSSGNLYVGGQFDDLSGGPGGTYNNIAMWNGAWNALGTGMNGTVWGLTFDNSGDLYAGGQFSTAGGNTANRVGVWDGGSWSTLGTGISSGTVYDLAINGKMNVYAGGTFNNAGGDPAADKIAGYGEAIPPQVTKIGAADGGNGILSEGENLYSGISKVTVTYTEDVIDGGGANAADFSGNYMLYSDGGDSVFSTVDCNGGVLAGESAVTVDSATYNSGALMATVDFNGGSPLANGSYRFHVCGTTSVEDLNNNVLAGDGINSGTDFVRSFSVGVDSESGGGSGLPATGFPKGREINIPTQHAEKAYADLGDLWLEIPSLGEAMSIVGVPAVGGEWDVSWLGGNAGYLEGTAFPTYPGNTGLTAHVWDNNNNLGPFALLKKLRFGDQVRIHAWGYIYTYAVRYNYLTTPGNMTPLRHEEYDWVTLLTCERYNSSNESYRYRRVVRAVLVDVSPE
jgi:LPXTG-site transpeptidase (sortase) family protein